MLLRGYVCRQVQGKLLSTDGGGGGGGNPKGSKSTAAVMTSDNVVYFLNVALTLPSQKHVELC